MSITHISKSETLKNNRLETGHIFLLISLLDKKCIHLAIFYCPCSMNLSPIPLSIQSMPFCIALPWYHMPIMWMPHCNMLIVWLPLYLYAKNPVAILLNDKLMYNMTVLRLLQNRRARISCLKNNQIFQNSLFFFNSKESIIKVIQGSVLIRINPLYVIGSKLKLM